MSLFDFPQKQGELSMGCRLSIWEWYQESENEEGTTGKREMPV